MNEDNACKLAKAVLAWARTDTRVAAEGWTTELERAWDERKSEMVRLARLLSRGSGA